MLEMNYLFEYSARLSHREADALTKGIDGVHDTLFLQGGESRDANLVDVSVRSACVLLG